MALTDKIFSLYYSHRTLSPTHSLNNGSKDDGWEKDDWNDDGQEPTKKPTSHPSFSPRKFKSSGRTHSYIPLPL